MLIRTCERMFHIHLTRLVNKYRLELVVSDHTAQAVVVVFDELSTKLVKSSAESLLKEDFEVYFQHFSCF